MVIHEEEVPQGYPDDIDRVIGQLAEACRHATQKCPELATILREHRLRVMDNAAYYPPYKDLLAYVRILIACEDEGIVYPELPDSLKLTLSPAG